MEQERQSPPPAIKILVGYHKPATLLKSDILTPIHLGRALACRASKDGTMSKADYQWMLDHMIGDDTGDNISHLNRAFAELTGIYWAWKNYDKLGNPDYIGFMHYRRHFKEADINSYADYDIIAPEKKIGHATIEKQFQKTHPIQYLKALCQIVTEKNPTYKKAISCYLKQKSGFFYNMFIMKKEEFFEYCQFLFDSLFELDKQINYEHLSFENQRLQGFLAERLTGMFIKIQKMNKRQVKPCEILFRDMAKKEIIQPIFGSKSINICFSSDNAYAPYMCVSIASIKVNRKPAEKYDICVIDSGISNSYKQRILALADEKFSIRFVDISGWLSDINPDIFYSESYFTASSYYRIFIPQIFSKFTKMLYLDCDIIVHKNIAELFATPLHKYGLGAVVDVCILKALDLNEKIRKQPTSQYLTQTLKMTDLESYFNAGVLLMDVQALYKANFTNLCIRKLLEIKTPMYVEQDLINALVDGKYKKLDMKWNVFCPFKNILTGFNVNLYQTYKNALDNVAIIHYVSRIKPWNNPTIPLAHIWWQYARQTPFYEEMLFKLNTTMLVANVERLRHKMKYLKYKILSKITFGNMRKRYQKKKKEYKNKLKFFNQFLSEFDEQN